MLRNKLLILSLACAILAVTAIGSASASDYYFYDYLMSYIDPDNNYVAINTDYQPAGNKDVTINDRIIWFNAYYNYKSVDVSTFCQSDTNPSGGGYIEDNGQKSISPGQYFTDIQVKEKISINPTQTYIINARHVYDDGFNTYYSDYTGDGMKFH